VNANAEIIRKAIAAVSNRVLKNVTNGVFCHNVATSGKKNVVPFLLTLISLAAVGSLCNNVPTFKTKIFRIHEIQPSSMPSSSPSDQPTHNPTPLQPKLVTTKFFGFKSIIFLFGCCGCCCFMRMYPATLKKKKIGHKYDILLMTDNEEIIMENIDHENIAFY
jgi:hypothetical protein